MRIALVTIFCSREARKNVTPRRPGGDRGRRRIGELSAARCCSPPARSSPRGSPPPPTPRHATPRQLSISQSALYCRTAPPSGSHRYLDQRDSTAAARVSPPTLIVHPPRVHRFGRKDRNFGTFSRFRYSPGSEFRSGKWVISVSNSKI